MSHAPRRATGPPRRTPPAHVLHPDAAAVSLRRWPPDPGRPVPQGYHPIPTDLLGCLTVLPCPVFVPAGHRAVLYAAAGAVAADLGARLENGLLLLIRAEDAELLRSAVAAELPRVLGDARASPEQRSRRAYAMTTQVVGPLFVAGSRVGRQALVTAHEAVDAVSRALLDEEDLLWSMVATMQRHLQTHTHAINTAVYAVMLARLLTITAETDVADVGRGALLHDIGKNRVPDRILDKPGPLDEGEWRIMRTHPEVGFEIVTRTLGTVPSYAHIILEHHERVNGSGYPAGRTGDDVPLDSQLVAIADAFDALTSPRPYKGPSSPFEALRIMRFEMAGQFNERVLREFILIVGDRARFRRAEYRSLEAARLTPPAAVSSGRLLGRQRRSLP
jgi:putative nucleotidyltransferase with HDIG domain